MSETTPVVPAPWSLTGGGYIVAFRMPRALLDDGSFLDPALKRSRRGGIAWVMFVDYERSDCGPYHELLYIPGSCRFGERRLLTISRIFVSSQSSVDNGRRNWGIPKDRCDFDVRYGADGVDDITASLDGKPFAKLQLRSRGPRLPVTTALVPKSWRTLGQQRDGQEFVYTPSARGSIRPAKLLSVWTDPVVFPDLALGKPLLAVRVARFDMCFPVSDIRTLA